MKNITIIMNFLEQNKIQILSTICNNKPVSRPIGSAMFAKNRIWYCMNNDKPMFIHLMENPMICICVCANDYSWLRIHARVVFSNDKDIKTLYLERGSTRFKDVCDPCFSVFYLSEVNAELHKKGKVEYYTFT